MRRDPMKMALIVVAVVFVVVLLGGLYVVPAASCITQGGSPHWHRPHWWSRAGEVRCEMGGADDPSQ